MGATSDAEVVLELFRRFGHEGLDPALELIAEDAVFEIPGDMSAEPDVYEGHAGARRYFAGFDDLLEDLRFEPIEIEQVGEAVTLWIRFTGRGVTSGIEVQQYAAINVWLSEGKVVRMHPHPDMDAARAALR
jgi:ketosteroid isomerase-like protein